jgi:hypothetical protein
MQTLRTPEEDRNMVGQRLHVYIVEFFRSFIYWATRFYKMKELEHRIISSSPVPQASSSPSFIDEEVSSPQTQAALVYDSSASVTNPRLLAHRFPKSPRGSRWSHLNRLGREEIRFLFEVIFRPVVSGDLRCNGVD